MSETRTPSEWCSLLDWHILDPDGWREDGLSWFEPITRDDFERRAAMSTARGPRAGSSVPEAARAEMWELALPPGLDSETVARSVRACMALANEAVAAAVAEERATTGRRIEAALALCQDANGYTTHDQIEKLGAPPWRGMDANLIAWEQAHGHDVRLGCDRTDCLLLIDPEDLRAALASPGEET